MGIFERDRTGEIEELKSMIAKYQRERKTFTQELSSARTEITSLKLQLQEKISEAINAGLKFEKLKERQKNSVERANRYLAQLKKLKPDNENLS